MEDATTKGSMAPNTGQQREVAATVVQGGKVHTKMLVKKNGVIILKVLISYI